MKSYADIMLVDEKKPRFALSKKLTRLNIILIISTLVFALSTSIFAIVAYNLDRELDNERDRANYYEISSNCWYEKWAESQRDDDGFINAYSYIDTLEEINDKINKGVSEKDK